MAILAEHADAGVERLALDGEQSVLASCAQDQTIRLWDVGTAQAGMHRGLRLMLPEVHS